MRRIEWGYQASVDLEDIADHYGAIVPDLAEKMIHRVEKAALPLLDYPSIGVSVGHSGLRKWNAAKTPFLLLYLVTGDLIYIVRVVHAESDWDHFV